MAERPLIVSTVLAAVFVLAGNGAIKFGDFSFSPDAKTTATSAIFIFGLLIVGAGLVAEYRPRRLAQKRIVFYVPTIRRNPFFGQLLEQISDELRGDRSIELVIEKGAIADNSFVDRSAEVVRHYIGRHPHDTVLIIVPSSPDKAIDLLRFDPASEVNVILLDVPVPADAFEKCGFLRHSLVIDNQKGCRLAAETAAEYCRKNNLSEAQFICCEGEFHDRAKIFWQELRDLAAKSGLRATRLDGEHNVRFAAGLQAAYAHVESCLDQHAAAMQQQHTLIFCANDSMTLGARFAVGRFSAKHGVMPNVKIIGFDGSDIVTDLIHYGDPFVRWSIDQRYDQYASRAVALARDILSGSPVPKTVTRIEPGIYR